MSDKSSTQSQSLEIFKKLISQLDNKFGSIELQLDKIESKIDNFRAYVERNHIEVLNEIKQLKFPKFLDEPQIKPMESPLTQESKSKKAPTVPTPASSPIISSPQIQDSFQKFPNLSQTQDLPSSGINTQFGGLKPTPIVEAFKEEEQSSLDTDSLHSDSKRKQIQKDALQGYLEKLEREILKTWPTAERHLKQKESEKFIDKSLTVLHGIIEFTFVAFRNEFPDPNLSYYDKAKNISGLGLFKDVSLLEKIETVYEQIQNKESPVLANTLLLGWKGRISKIYIEFKVRKKEAYERLHL